MLSFRRIKKDEQGSASLEFIAMVPYVFLLMAILWQLVVGAYALITVQSAANEAAKVFSVSLESGEALQAARDIINRTGDSIRYSAARSYVSGVGRDGSFSVRIGVDLDLAHLPDKFFPNRLTIPITQKTVSRVIK